jgi:hypothetical protein
MQNFIIYTCQYIIYDINADAAIDTWNSGAAEIVER